MWKHPSIDEIKESREKHKDIFGQVQELVNDWEPIGLVSGGAPKDEYDCITVQLIDLLIQGKNQVNL